MNKVDDDPKEKLIERDEAEIPGNQTGKSPKIADEPMSDEELENEKKFHEAETERD
jgi:hypothetical protein